METVTRGHLLIIGGAEDKTDGSVILKQASEMLGGSDVLTVLTTATEKPEEVGQNYLSVFSRLGVKNVQVLNIATREEAGTEAYIEKIRRSKCVFMTGGDQLRITSILGGTSAGAALKSLYASGGIVMGTSAGASVMSSTMIVKGDDNEPAKKCTLKMAPGLGLIGGVIIDQHFDQRGRFGRLLCGIAENPEVIGIGIDEDTAVKVFPDLHFEVIGTNAVSVIDGSTIESSNVSELQQNEILAIVGVKVSVLPQGYGFDLLKRKVIRFKSDEGESDQHQ
ncbi:cyanophycinase [Sporobacter termitidis DSM 10068]|uniref:Cyanophycinase n=1 Tax=Sporobacter termitidis DSM 10068 TaxID=1123282 RepID=A0A1M5YDU5_9FIRM|nr:cyanophycinase [Sporobacter termitidis]SHI10205.1 cyanophycinase [Sporobacter termitidis DSM 10068]